MDIRSRILNALFDRRYKVPRNVIARISDFHIGLRAMNRTVSGLRNNPIANGGFETVELRQSTSRLVDVVSVNLRIGELLYRLVKEFQPEYILELGTGIGTSGAFMLAANDRAYLLTLEGSTEIAALAERLLDMFGKGSYRILIGLFNDTVPTLQGEIPRVDFAFIDDEHRARATYRDMDYIPPLMPEGGVIVFDDINWQSAKQAWYEICKRSDCAYSCEPRFRGSRRIGIWVKGPRVPGYDGRPEIIELFGPQVLNSVWSLLRKWQRIMP